MQYYSLHIPIAMPLWVHVQRAPVFHAFSDASGWSIGGYCQQLQFWWQLEWPADIKERFNTVVGTLAAIWINGCELLGMLVNAWLALHMSSGLQRRECALLYGDNMTAVHRINRSGASDSPGPRGGHGAHIWGPRGIETEMSMTAVHVPGVVNDRADELPRCEADPAAAGFPFAACMQLTMPPQVCTAFLNVLRGCFNLLHWVQTP